MPETIHWTYSVRAQAGPAAVASGDLVSDGYEKLNVTIAAGAPAQEVTIGPGTWAHIHGLVVSASDFSGAIKVKPKGAATAVPLNGPVVLVGTGPIALLGTGAASLVFENTGAADERVDIFVARDATP